MRRDRRQDARPGLVKMYAYHQPGPGGLPLGLASTEGLGFIFSAPEEMIHHALRVCQEAPSYLVVLGFFVGNLGNPFWTAVVNACVRIAACGSSWAARGSQKQPSIAKSDA